MSEKDKPSCRCKNKQDDDEEHKTSNGTSDQPPSAESASGSLYPLPIKTMHRAKPNDRRSKQMEKLPKFIRVGGKIFQLDRNATAHEAAGKKLTPEKDSYVEDKNFDKDIEKNMEDLAEKGQEGTPKKTMGNTAAAHIKYRGALYEKV